MTVVLLNLGLLACEADTARMTDDALISTSVELRQVSSFGSNPGNLSMFEYVPATVATKNAPVVMALHGCTQSASDYQKTGWNTLADSVGAIIVYPQTTANGSCFAWWDPANARRGAGQALSMAQMVDSVKSRYAVGQVFITGLSAGGAMTNVMLAAYPEVFSAGAVMAGVPYRCADNQNAAYGCMFGSKNLSHTQWGDLVRSGAPTPRAYPRVAVWHGTSDGVVVPVNADEQILQWTNVNGVSATPTTTETVGPATVTRYISSNGAVQVESWRIAKMSHGTAVDPARGCGTAGAFILDVGLCSTNYAAIFFGLTDGDGGGTGGGSDAGAGGGSDGGGDGGSDAGTGGGSDGGGDGGSGGGTCTETFASNYVHTTARRAAPCKPINGHACTIGGNNDLGMWNLYKTSWVREVAPGYFEAGRCP